MPAAIAEPFRRRSWAELLYSVLGLPIGVAGFVFTVTTLSVSGGLLVTFVGLPLLAVTGLISRYAGSKLRRFANRLIGTNVPEAQRFHANPGLLGWIGSCLKDGTAWRARLYLLLKLPVGIAMFVAATVCWVYGFGGLTYATWRWALPCNTTSDGVCHHSIGFTDSWQADTPGRILLMTIGGLLLFLAAPWVVRGFVSIDRALVSSLLGPTGDAQRVAQLERSRAAAVDDSAATLRRIERDLHDGTQAQLVALAMRLGMAKETLDADEVDLDRVRELVGTAHQSAKQTLVELRDLARGILPPVLDSGLDDALGTLAARCPVAVSLDVVVPVRPPAAVAAIAYFCVAELLTNVVKHSGADRADVRVTQAGDQLVVAVSDPGHGGASATAGGGLRGLAGRIGAVDGNLLINSPDGGPTVVTVELPCGS